METAPGITAWTPARLYRTPSGLLFSHAPGPFEVSTNAVCVHGATPSPACGCGFTTMARREDAEQEALGLPLVEVQHLRAGLWTDGRLVRSLSLDVKVLHLSAECHECAEPAAALVEVPVDERATDDVALEAACPAHLGSTRAWTPEALSEALGGVVVRWRPAGEMARWVLEQELEETLAHALHALHGEQVLARLDDEDEVSQWALEILSGGPEEFVALLVRLHLVPLEQLEQRRAQLAQLLAFAGDREVAALRASGAQGTPCIRLLARLVN